MKHGMAKAVAFCLAAGLTLSGNGIFAMAAPGDVAGTTGFARTISAVNIRSSADTDGEVVGVLSNNDAVEIESVDENGWYKVRSGNVEGYVAGQFIATGSEASQVAADTGYTTAEVGAEVLNIRADKSTDSDVVATASEADNLEVVQNDGDWLKVVAPDGTYGWVSADYVYASTSYSTAKSVSEIEAEQAQASASSYQEPAQDTSASADTSSQAAADASYSAPAQTSSSDVASLYQAYLTAQEAAMHPTSADEAQQTADAAVAAYNAYINASNSAASQQVAAATGTQSTASSDAPAASSSDSDALYQAYLTAQEAAMHPTSEVDAEQKADAAVAAYNAYLASVGASDQAVTTTYESTAASTAAASETVPAETQAVSGSDADSLYQAYLAAQDAANHPTTAEDAQQKADAAIEAYNAYLAAAGAGTTAAAGTTANTTAETTAQTEAPQTEAPQTEAPQTEAPSTSSLGAQIASYATQFVGNPYVYGGSSLTGGADCSGFTMAVFAHFGIGLPHNAAAQSGCGTPVSLSDIQPGDLLFYDNGGGIGHVTIYIGNGQVCHASNERTGITISSYNYRTPVCAVRAW